MKKLTKQLLTGMVALGMLAPIATSSLNPIRTTVNAKRHHRSRRIRRSHHKIRRSRRGWHYLHYRGSKKYRYAHMVPASLWESNGSQEHWVLVKHNVRVHNISVLGTDAAHAYSIGTKTLHRGAVVKGYYPPSSPGGFNIMKGKGFNNNTRYERRHEAVWIVEPGGHPYHGLYSNYWMKAVK